MPKKRGEGEQNLFRFLGSGVMPEVDLPESLENVKDFLTLDLGIFSNGFPGLFCTASSHFAKERGGAIWRGSMTGSISKAPSGSSSGS